MEELSTTLLVFRDNVKVIVIKPTGLLDSCPNVLLYRDGYIHTSLIEAVKFCFEQGAEGVLIDLSETPFFADGGEFQLIMASKIAGGYNRRRKVFLCSLNDPLRCLVELCSLDRVFEIFADRETFIQYFNENLEETINTKNREVIEKQNQLLRVNNVIVIKPTGLLGSSRCALLNWDGYIYTSLKKAVKFCLEPGVKGVLIDLSKIHFVADLGELLMACTIARAYNRKVFLCSLNKPLIRLLEISNLNRVVKIFADRETFIQYFNETLKETINTKNQEVIENTKNQEVIENTEKQNQPMNCPLGLECIENQNEDCENSSYCRGISSPINLPLLRVNDDSFLSGGYGLVEFPRLSNLLNYHQLSLALYRDLHEVGYDQSINLPLVRVNDDSFLSGGYWLVEFPRVSDALYRDLSEELYRDVSEVGYDQPINLPLVRVNDESFLSGGYWLVEFPELSNYLAYYKSTSALYRDISEAGYYQTISVFRENLTILHALDRNWSSDGVGRCVSRRTPYSVKRAFSVVTTMELARSIIPVLIIIEMNIFYSSDIDPCELIRQIKADPIIKAIPVIAVDYHHCADYLEKLLAAGFDDYDTKPVDCRRLVEKIQGWVKKATAQ